MQITNRENVSEIFSIKNLGKYHDFYGQSDTCWLIHSKTFAINVLRYMNLISLTFKDPWITMESMFENDRSSTRSIN